MLPPRVKSPSMLELPNTFSSPNDPQSNLQPQIEFIYTSGSNQKPLPPYITSTINQDSPYPLKKTSFILQKI